MGNFTHDLDWRGWPIKRPFPWERKMTVCIAAECGGTGSPDNKIVLCADARTGGALGSAETAFKIHYLKKQWALLASGDEPDILAIAKLFRRKFQQSNATTPENLDASIREPLFERKKALAEQYVRNRFAISYDDFIKFGRDKLPDDLHRDAVRAIANLDLRVEAIIAGYQGKSPEIYYFDVSGTVHIANDYAVVGSGEYLAHAALLRREQSRSKTLDQTLYNVFEAKKLSESVGSVGLRTNMMILTPEGCEHTSLALDDHLQKMFDALKPRPISMNIGFEGVYTFGEEEAAERAAAAEAQANETRLLPGISGAEEGSSTFAGLADQTKTAE